MERNPPILPKSTNKNQKVKSKSSTFFGEDEDEKDTIENNPFLDPIYFERNRARLEDITLREPSNSRV